MPPIGVLCSTYSRYSASAAEAKTGGTTLGTLDMAIGIIANFCKRVPSAVEDCPAAASQTWQDACSTVLVHTPATAPHRTLLPHTPRLCRTFKSSSTHVRTDYVRLASAWRADLRKMLPNGRTSRVHAPRHWHASPSAESTPVAGPPFTGLAAVRWCPQSGDRSGWWRAPWSSGGPRR